MSEFRIHHDVNELLSLLRVRGGDGAEVYIDLLQKNRTPYVTTTVSAHSAKVSARPGTALCAEFAPVTGARGSARGGGRQPWASAVGGPDFCSARRLCWALLAALAPLPAPTGEGELGRDGHQPDLSPDSLPRLLRGGRAETQLPHWCSQPGADLPLDGSGAPGVSHTEIPLTKQVLSSFKEMRNSKL